MVKKRAECLSHRELEDELDDSDEDSEVDEWPWRPADGEDDEDGGEW